MGGKLDQIKGRIKEAAGALADDDNLKKEGNLDQGVGKVKEKAEKAIDTIKNALTEQKTSQQDGIMRRMGRQGKRRGDRMARSVKLILLPCLCDLKGPAIMRDAPCTLEKDLEQPGSGSAHLWRDFKTLD